MIEYWKADTLALPVGGTDVGFKYKTETDLYALAKVGKVSLIFLHGHHFTLFTFTLMGVLFFPSGQSRAL